MDFRSLLQSMTSLSEAETKDTKTGRVHKGDYGTSHEAGDEGVKKQETQRGRGRPKKDADETGEVKKYDTKTLGSVFGGGQKPKKDIGTVSKKHSLKEYIESVEESIEEGETIEKKGGRVHKGSYGTSYEAGDEGVKKAETTRGRGRPKKDSDETGEVKSYDTKSLGNVFGGGKAPKKEVGKVSASHKIKEGQIAPIQIKPASQTNTQVIQQGDKTLGTVTNPQLAAQIKQSIGKGEMTLNPDESMSEEVDMGQYDAKKPSTVDNKGDWDKDFREKLKQFTKELAQHQAQKNSQVAEGAKPDFLDVDKDSDKKESFKKALKDKEAKKKVDEGRDHASSEYTDEAIGKILAREKPGMDSASDEFYSAVYHELIQMGLTPKAARYKLNVDEDFMGDVASAYSQFQNNPSLDEGSVDDFRIDGVKPTSNFAKTSTSMAQPKGTPTMANRPVAEPTPFGTDPIQATTDRAINFISGLRKPSNPFSESTTMKDMQVESWSKQLDSLLNEGITVSSSTGQQGQPDSVSVTASDNDAQALLTVLRQAGIGGFGPGEQPQAPGYGVVSQGEEEATGTGTEPQDAPAIVGDGDDMMALIKKMAGIDATGADTYSDYADEEGSDGDAEVGILEPADSDEEGSEEESSGEEESGEEEEEQTDEGNAFTGKLKQTQQGEEFKMGDKSYKDTSSLEEEGHDHDEEETCNECGGAMYEGHACGQEQVEENYANSASDPADTELMKLKALLAMGNDLHKQKSSQAMGNPVRVAESKQMIADWKKLSGI